MPAVYTKLSQLPSGQAISPLSGTITIDGAVIGGSTPENATFLDVTANNILGSPIYSTALNGILRGNASDIVVATAGVNYSAGTSLLATGILKSTTSTGNLTIAAASDIDSTFGSQTQNIFYASPNGSSGNPSFRAIVAADIPTLNQNTTGSSASCTGNSTGTSISSSPTTLTVTGDITTLTAGENEAFGDIVYIKSDGKVWKGDESTSGEFPAQFMCTGTVSANATGTYLLRGFATNSSWTWTVGGAIYLSTAGGMTQTPPSSTGNCIQVLGYALSATVIYFNPSPDYITHT